MTPNPTYKDLQDSLAALQLQKRKQQDRLRLKASALARISDAVIAIDDHDRVTYWNAAAKRMYDLSAEEAIGKKLSDCFEVRWLEPDHDDVFHAALASDGWWQGESVHVTRSGRHIHADSSIGVLSDSEDHPIGTLAVIRDVTSRKLAEQALRESEERYRTLFTSMSEGFGLAQILRDEKNRSVDYRLLEVNPAFGALTGFTPEEANGRTARELFGNVDPRWIAVFDRVVSGGESASFEGYSARLDKWFQVYVFAAGEDRFGHLLIDVSERKRVLQELRDSRARIAGIVGSAMDAIISVDEDRKIVLFNEAASAMLSCPVDEALGQSLSRFIPEPQQLTQPGETNGGFQSSGALGEIRGRRADGEEFPIEASVSRIEAGGKKLVTVILRDITARKRDEEALERARDELEQRVGERTAELAASNAELQRRSEQLGHLASQLTLAEQRERRRLAQVLHDHLQQLLVGAEFGLEVLARRVREDLQPAVAHVRRLLDESITASRSLTVELSPPILHEAGLVAGLEWLARWMQENHSLTVDLDVDPEASVSRDDVKILVFEAVRELLFNVVKHAGSLRARVTLEREGADGVRIVVSDSGVGFDPESMWAGENRTEGGFGLFSIRERMSLLGCRMEIESAPGRGATFTLIAPGRAEPAGEIRARKKNGRRSGAKESTASPSEEESRRERAIRVLLADDHAVMRQGLLLLLKEESGIEVVGEASDGEDAVAMARRMRPDVIVMDLGMPRMNGLEATRVIHREFPEIHIIGLSMFEEGHWAMAMLEAGATAHFTKSGEPSALLSAIRGLRPPQ